MRPTLVITLFTLLGLAGNSFAQHDCPAYPKRGTFDTLTYIKTEIPTDPLKANGIWLGQGEILRNGSEIRRAYIPDNRPEHALAIAHAWNYHRNIVHRVESPHIGYWLATIVQESEYMCDPGAVWGDPNEAPPLYTTNNAAYLSVANTLESGASGTAGCYQIEGPNGSAWFQLGQNYPQGRFPNTQWANLAGGQGTFTTAALVKSYYDVYTKEVWQNVKGWDVYESIDCAADEYAYEKTSASGYNGGINAFGSNGGFLQTYPNGNTTNNNWAGMAATTGGYADDVAKWISVLEDNTGYPTYPTGSSFGGYYNENISWADVTSYLGDLAVMYTEYNFATDVTPNVQAAFESIAGSTAGTIPFQDVGPVIDAIILSLPREYPQVVEGSPTGIKPNDCSGAKVPYAGLKILAGPADIKPGCVDLCLGESITVEIEVEGGGGPSPTYKWYKNSDPGTILSTDLIYTITPTAAGLESWGVEVCNGSDCYKVATNTENSCMDSRNANGFWINTTDCSTCSFVAAATKVNTPCKGMAEGSITLNLTNAPANYSVTYTANTPLGVVTNTFNTSGNTVQLDDLRDGSYTFELEDLSDPTCKAYTSVIVGYDTDINEYVDAQINGISGCVADVEANIVELPQPCTWTVWAYVPTFFTWDLQTLASVRTSTGLLSTDAFTRIAPKPEIDTWNDVELYELEFELNTGDEIFFGTSLTTALGSQIRDLRFELFDETGASVYTVTSPAGSAQPNSPPIEVGSYTVTCPYTPPNGYTFNWTPSIANEVTTSTSSQGDATVITTDRTFVVTATNNANSQCVLTDSVVVTGDLACGVTCEDPGTVTLSPASPAAQCGGIVTLTASETGTPPAGGFEYEFFMGATSVQGPGSSNTYDASATGSYTVVVTDPADASTCTATSSAVTVTIDAAPSASNAGTDQTICATTATLAGNTPATGTGAWSVTSGTATITTASDPTSGVTGLGTGANVLRWTISNGSCPDETSEVTITVDANPSTANAGTDQTICATTATLAGNTPATGTGAWTVTSGSATITTASSPTSGLTGLGTGTNVLRWTISNGSCPDETDEVIITVDDTPSTSNAGPDQTVCGTAATLAGNTPATGTGAWTVISGSATITTASSPSSGVTGLGSGANVLRWTISNGSCPDETDEVTITSEDAPSTSAAGTDQNVCGTTATLAGNTPATGTGVWTLISGSGTVTTPADPASGVTGLGTGANVFRWTISNGSCIDETDEVTITSDATPSTADAGTDQTVCGTTATLAGNTPATGTGAWTVISGSATITTTSSPTSGVTALGTGANVLRWTISNGSCPDETDEVTITSEATPSTANAGTDQSICGTDATLAGNTPATGTGQWSVVSGSATITTLSDPASTVTGLAVGATTLRWTISNGSCPDETDEVTITASATPDAADAGTDQNLCADNATMGANTPATGTGAWSVTSGGPVTFADATDPITNVTSIPVGTTVLRWTISNGSCPDETDEVTIDRTASAAADVSINPTTPAPVCAGASFTFTAIPVNGGATPNYEWFINNVSQGAPGTTATQSVSSPADGDSIHVIMTSSLGCATGSPATSSAVYITLDTPPTASAAGTDQNLCADSYTMTANTPATGTGTWSVITGSGTFSSNTDPTATVSSLGVGTNTFRWTISNGTCPDETDEITITRSGALTTANAGTDQTVCESGTLTLAGNAAGAGETGTWTITSGTGTITSPNSETSTVTGITAGTLSLQWELDNGVCPTSTDIVDITIEAQPSTANAGTDQSVCANGATLAGNTPTTGTGQWSVVSGTGAFGDATDPTTTVTGLSTGLNQLQWEITNGSCGSTTDVVDITVTGALTAANAGTDQTVCESGTLTLAGNAVGAGETGTWTVITGTGTITSPNSETSTVTGISAGTLSLQWEIDNGVCTPSTDIVDITIEAQPSTANAGTDQSVCANGATLAGNTPTTGTGQWTVISGAGTFADATNPTTTVTGLNTGVNQLQWEITNGSCGSTTDVVDITVTGNLTAADAGTDETICETQTTYNLNGNSPQAGETGMWTVTSGSATFADATNPTTTISSLINGSTTLVWTIDNGVCTPTTSEVTITVEAAPTTSNAGTDQSVCSGAINMAANTATVGTGMWTVESGAATITTTTDPTTSVTVTTSPAVLRWTITNGTTCPASTSEVTLTATGTPSPAVAIAVDNNPVCITGTATLTATPTDGGTTPSYEWFIGGISQGTTTTNTFTANGSDFLLGDASVEMTSSLSCASATPVSSSSISFTVVNGTAPVITTGDQNICEGTTQTLTAAGIGTITWLLDGTPMGTGNMIDVSTMSDAGTWTVESDDGVCPVSTSNPVTVTVDAAPTVSAGPDQTVELGESVTLQGSTSAGTVSWTPATDLNDANVETPTATPSSATNPLVTYTITATSGACTVTDDMELTIRLPIIIPNAFSPNSDGTNDDWEISGVATYPDAILQIFNRWGTEVYRSVGTVEPWDGMNGGEVMPTATYYFLLDLRDGTEPVTGSVTLVR